MALAAGGGVRDRPVIDKGRQYIAEHLLDEGEASPGDSSTARLATALPTARSPRHHQSRFALRAMKEAGATANDPAREQGVQFLQRSRTTEAKQTIVVVLRRRRVHLLPGNSQITGTTRSYGSGTYAGIMSYSWANVKKSDERVQSALK
jgi:hypothetical protein